MHPNQGQWDDRIQYKMDLDYGELLVENKGMTFQLYDLKIHEAHHQPNYNPQFHVIKTQFVNSLTPSDKIEQNKTVYYRNYLTGNDQSKWKTHVQDVQDVVYNNLYNGIDIHYSSKNDQLEYSLIVHPNIDASQIQLNIEGSDKIAIMPNGSLEITTIFGTIIQSPPLAYTIDVNGNKKNINCEFQLDKNTLHFLVEKHNTEDTLIIDPQLTFSSFTGSTADNWGYTACPDDLGDLYAGGIVFGAGYPVTAGVFDATFTSGLGTGYHIDIGISKFNPNGTALLYSTYLGGSGNETPNSLVTNSAGELFILGVTSSLNFPVTATAFQPNFGNGSNISQNEIPFGAGTDIFISHLSVNGDLLLGSTYIGGSGNDGLNYGSILDFNYGDQFRGMVQVDLNSNVYFTSSTQSHNFPAVNSSSSLNGTQDAVYGKLDATLSTMYFSSFFGGSGYETGNAIQLSHAGDIYVVGGTVSPSLPLISGGLHPSSQGGVADGFVIKINPTTGVVTKGTFLGTSNYDQCYFVQLDLDDKVYVLGQTKGSYPITSGIYSNPSSGQFIHKLSNDLSTSEWSTTIGASSGHEEISPTAFLVSDCYDIYFSGWGGLVNKQYSAAVNSSSNNLPTTSGAYETTTSGNNFYIAVLKQDAAYLKYATYFGGAASSYNHVDGGTSQFDKKGRIYHAVCGACGGNPHGFTSTAGAWSTTNNSTNCNLAAFKFELSKISSTIGNTNPLACIPSPVVFENSSLNGNYYVWNFGDGTNSFDENPVHYYTTPGDYIISLIVEDTSDCYQPDTAYFDITIGIFECTVQSPSSPICPGDTIQLHASGGNSYAWYPSQFIDDSTSADPNVSVMQNTTFHVIVTDSCGNDTLSVVVQVYNEGFNIIGDTLLCSGDSIPLDINLTSYDSIEWLPSSIFVNNHISPTYTNPDTTTLISVNLISSEGCLLHATYQIYVDTTPPKIQLPDSVSYCQLSGYQVTVSGGRNYIWSPHYFISDTSSASVYINSPKDTLYYVVASNACGNTKDSIAIHVIKVNAKAGNDTIICPGQTALVWASGGVDYSWSPSSTMSDPISDISYAKPIAPTHYSVIVTDSNGCRDTAYVYVNLYPHPYVDAGSDYYGFIGDPIELSAQGSGSGTYSWSPTEYASCVDCQTTTVSPPKNIAYEVHFTDQNGCVATDNISIIFDGIIYVPNTFTPNGDKSNPLFKAYGGNINTFDFMIFDRWGELIFNTTDFNSGWDGTYEGMNSPDGVYVWKIIYSDISTKIRKELIGHVTLLR